MTRSKNFWAGIVLLALIPLLLIDVAQHNVNWKKEVREEMISAVHDHYEMTREERAVVLDRILERNQVLTGLIYTKSIASVLCLALAIFLLVRSAKQGRKNYVASAGIGIAVAAAFIGIKIWAAGMITNEKVRLLPPGAETLTLQQMHERFYKDKVLYIDFWGTTCGPCLKEFRDYTNPLKKKYEGQTRIAYLYISRGDRYTWKQQLQKYNVEGDHLFLEGDAYDRLYREAAKDSNVHITMPRYVIMAKDGTVVNGDAQRPSAKSGLYLQLDRYLLDMIFPLY